MEMHPSLIRNGPYVVMTQDGWDYYYKNPPIRNGLFESENYFEAVSFAMRYYDQCDKDDLQYPNTQSLWISPEPVGMHFDYNKYIDHSGNILDLLLSNAPQSLSRIEVMDMDSVCSSDHFPNYDF